MAKPLKPARAVLGSSWFLSMAPMLSVCSSVIGVLIATALRGRKDRGPIVAILLLLFLFLPEPVKSKDKEEDDFLNALKR